MNRKFVITKFNHKIITTVLEDVSTAEGLGGKVYNIVMQTKMAYEFDEFFDSLEDEVLIEEPTEEEIQYAKDVFETIEKAKAEGKGVVSLRGKMIDPPIVARAKQVLEAAEAMKGGR